MKNKSSTELPVFDGSTPLPYMGGFKFKSLDGRIGTLVNREVVYARGDKLVKCETLIVEWE